MIIKAYAKINLTLDITGVRDDGFHELKSIMCPISLCDEIRLEKSDELVFKCNIQALETEDNLCVKAAKSFFERANISGSACIELTKNIPFPAGLGGGSSDAAAILRGLNRLYDFPLDNKALFELASKLGSDVSVCLLGKVALCEGRGEILTEIGDIPSYDVVIAIGKSRLSTPAVYRELDAMGLPVRNDTCNFLTALSNKGDLISTFGNAFEPVADILAPETKELRQLMTSSGALCSHLSGSGPSVYGVFSDEKSAKNAVELIENKGFTAFQCKIL